MYFWLIYSYLWQLFWFCLKPTALYPHFRSLMPSLNNCITFKTTSLYFSPRKDNQKLHPVFQMPSNQRHVQRHEFFPISAGNTLPGLHLPFFFFFLSSISLAAQSPSVIKQGCNHHSLPAVISNWWAPSLQLRFLYQSPSVWTPRLALLSSIPLLLLLFLRSPSFCRTSRHHQWPLMEE